MTKLDEVATAIEQTLGALGYGPFPGGEMHLVATKALVAMRDTNEGMYHAANAAFKDPDNQHGDVLGECFNASIDAALEGK